MFLKYYFPILNNILKDLFSDPKKLGNVFTIITKIKRILELKHVTEIFPEVLIEKIGDNDTSFKLIDIRNEKDFNGDMGHIKGAISIPLLDLMDDLDKLKKYKNTELIIICEVGRSSKLTAHLLSHRGYKNLKNLTGGMDYWIKRGYPIMKKNDRKA